MRALEFADVRLPDIKRKGQAKACSGTAFVEESHHALKATELLTLLAIAYRQRDESEDYADKDCICYATPEVLADIAHLGPSAVKDAARLLTVRGLVTYRKKGVYKSVKDPSKKATYKNVYQLNMAELEEIRRNVPRRKLYQIGLLDDMCDEKSHDAAQDSHDAAQKSHHAATNITGKITENTTIGGGDIDNVRNYIAKLFGIPFEKIGKSGIKTGIKGKNLADVKKAIDDYHKECSGRKIAGNYWIGTIVNKLKELPREKSPAEMSDAEIAALFSDPVPVGVAVDPKQAARDKGLDRLVNDLRLGELSEERSATLRSAFNRRFGSFIVNDLKNEIERFVKDFYYDNGGSAESMVEKLPDVESRFSRVLETLEKGVP